MAKGKSGLGGQFDLFAPLESKSENLYMDTVEREVSEILGSYSREVSLDELQESIHSLSFSSLLPQVILDPSYIKELMKEVLNNGKWMVGYPLNRGGKTKPPVALAGADRQYKDFSQSFFLLLKDTLKALQFSEDQERDGKIHDLFSKYFTWDKRVSYYHKSLGKFSDIHFVFYSVFKVLAFHPNSAVSVEERERAFSLLKRLNPQKINSQLSKEHSLVSKQNESHQENKTLSTEELNGKIFSELSSAEVFRSNFDSFLYTLGKDDCLNQNEVSPNVMVVFKELFSADKKDNPFQILEVCENNNFSLPALNFLRELSFARKEDVQEIIAVFQKERELKEEDIGEVISQLSERLNRKLLASINSSEVLPKDLGEVVKSLMVEVNGLQKEVEEKKVELKAVKSRIEGYAKSLRTKDEQLKRQASREQLIDYYLNRKAKNQDLSRFDFENVYDKLVKDYNLLVQKHNSLIAEINELRDKNVRLKEEIEQIEREPERLDDALDFFSISAARVLSFNSSSELYNYLEEKKSLILRFSRLEKPSALKRMQKRIVSFYEYSQFLKEQESFPGRFVEMCGIPYYLFGKDNAKNLEILEAFRENIKKLNLGFVDQELDKIFQNILNQIEEEFSKKY